MSFLGSLIGAGASLIGGIMGKDSAEDNAARQAALQKQFAKEGIQWKVEDAKKAGVHPLYALGASTHSYSPVSISDPLPSAIAEAGNTVGRGVHASMNAADRGGAAVLQKLAIDRARLQNDQLRLDLIASQNKLLTQAGTAKPMGSVVPLEGSPDAAPRLLVGGEPMTIDQSWSNAEEFTKRYGEGADWIYGPRIWLNDLAKSGAYRTSHEGLRKRFGPPPAWLQRLTGERR